MTPRTIIAVRVLALLSFTLAASPAQTAPPPAAVWYLGVFTGSAPLDDADCGTGRGAHPGAHPCATLAYWNTTRRHALGAGDTVRLTGVFGPVASEFHCIIPTPGVTYEGRTADDETAHSYEGATIDAADTVSFQPCHGGAINCRTDPYCEGFANFTLRDLTLANAPGIGGEGNQLMPGAVVTSGLRIERVRFTGSAANGLLIGSAADSEDNPCKGVRNVRDVTILDSQFDHDTLRDAQAGLWLTCTDGGLISGATAFDNRGENVTQAECMEDDDQDGCESHRGFQFGGWINGLMQQSAAYDNGYYNINFSGNGAAQCDAPTHDVVLDGIVTHDAGAADISFSHCNYNITVKNSFAWGHGLGVNQYSCAHHLKFYNNTFWADRAIQLATNCRACEFRNNILRCNSPHGCVFVDRASRNALTTWDHNVLVNEGTGVALAVFNDNTECVGTPGGACDCPGSAVAVCPNSDPQSPGCPSPWKDDESPVFGNDELTAFRADAMFGSETGDGDTWNAAPSVVDASAADETALHLSPVDMVARDTGVAIPEAFFQSLADFDGDARPQGAAWDVGADEIPQPTQSAMTPSPSPSTTGAATATIAAGSPTPTAIGTPAGLPTVTPTPTVACGPSPRSGCRRPTAARRSQLVLRNRIRDRGDMLTWGWAKGAATAKADFGAPPTATSYELCVYDEVQGTPHLALAALVPAGGSCGKHPCWRTTRHGFAYANKDATPDGVAGLVLKEGAQGSARISVRAKGPHLTMATLPLAQSSVVTVQLMNTDVCWEATFRAPAAVNTAVRFKDLAE